MQSVDTQTGVTSGWAIPPEKGEAEVRERKREKKEKQPWPARTMTKNKYWLHITFCENVYFFYQLTSFISNNNNNINK